MYITDIKNHYIADVLHTDIKNHYTADVLHYIFLYNDLSDRLNLSLFNTEPWLYIRIYTEL